jgi:hypothetical protein
MVASAKPSMLHPQPLFNFFRSLSSPPPSPLSSLKRTFSPCCALATAFRLLHFDYYIFWLLHFDYIGPYCILIAAFDCSILAAVF